MWPPTNVVKEDKRRANFIWISLVMLIIGYALWLIISTSEKRKNPTVSLSIKDDRYAYPTITVCAFAELGVGYGCDSPYYSCAQTINSFINNLNGFENIKGDIYTFNVSVTNEAYPYSCVDLDLSDMVESEKGFKLHPLRLTFAVQWYLNKGTDSDDTDSADYQLENSEGAHVYFTDPEVSNPLGSHELSTFAGAIPFTRQSAGDIPDSFTMTSITMKLTESVNLDGSNVKTYTAGTISSQDYLIPSWEIQSSTRDVAILFMEILQPSLTHTIRKEVDPLEWAELLGSIGGTWELLLILWGIFFMARQGSEPKLKGRDFVRTVQEGAQNIVRVAALIASWVGIKRGLEKASPSEREETMPPRDMPSTTTPNGPIDQARRPPPKYDFSGGQSLNSAAGCHDQASNDTGCSRPSMEGLICSPSCNTPAIDDLPRPAHRPL